MLKTFLMSYSLHFQLRNGFDEIVLRRGYLNEAIVILYILIALIYIFFINKLLLLLLYVGM